MAKGNYFKPSHTGYRDVMLSGEIRTVCEVKAGSLAASAARQSGIAYGIDSMAGLSRIHTRVSTQTRDDFYRERHYHALSIAVGAAGGNATGMKRYRTLAKAQKSAMSKHNRGARKRNSDWRY